MALPVIMNLPYPLNRAVNVLIPFLLLSMGACFGAYTFAYLLFVERKPELAFNLSHWKDQSFTNFWMWFGPLAAKGDIATVPAVAGLAQGVVVDVGPGSGQNVRHFDRKKITKLYFIEPCLGLHEELKANLKKAGLQDVATIIPCGVQDTSTIVQYGLRPGSVDSIVTIKVLCSVPNQQEMCRSLYSLLKPGGQWLVYEHVIADEQYTLSRVLQHIYNLAWPHLMGNCNVTRDTGKSLRNAGEWEKVDFGRGKDEVGWEMLGHIVGRLVKAK